MKRAPLSCCFITVGEPTLEAAVASVRPFVEEIAILYTASEPDVETAKRVCALADRYDWYDGANWPGGGMRDFAKARNRSFALASLPTAMWLDADDEFEGGEHLAEMCRQIPAARAFYYNLPYHYQVDEEGRTQCVVMRERIVSPARAFRWVHPVHETLAPAGPVEVRAEVRDLVRVVHRRPKRVEAGSVARNLRILRAEHEATPDDPWTLFNFGQALYDARDFREAERVFGRYLAVDGTQEDQRAVACIRTAFGRLVLGDPEGGVEWARRAVEEREWAESYVALAFAHQGAATRRGDGEKRHWERAAHYARLALSLPPTAASTTTMALNPLDRSFVAPSVLSAALGHLGDTRGALEAAVRALEAVPEDRALLTNALVYEAEETKAEIERQKAALAELVRKAEGMGKAGLVGPSVVADVRRRAGAEPVRTPGRYDVAFMCGVAPEPWNPHIAATEGIGGSETAVIEVAKRLAKRGHTVRVYCNSVVEMVEDDVRYLPVERFAPEPCDVLVGWRQAQFVHVAEARVRWTWVHDIALPGVDEWAVHRTDRVLGLSGWHVAEIAAQGVDVAKIHQTANGIDHERFTATGAERDPKVVVFSSAPSRGLGELLMMWPHVREEVPGAELHVYYGFDSWEASVRRSGDEAGLARIDELKARAAETEGVVMHGRVNGATLARAMMRAGVWVNPGWDSDIGKFHETFCIGICEAQAAGLRVVAAAHGGMAEQCRNGALVDLGDGPDWVEQFAGAVVGALKAPERRGERERIADDVADLSWDRVVDQWEAWMKEDMEKAEQTARVESAERRTLHIVLSPDASGRQVIDPTDPTGGALGGGSKAGAMGLAAALGRLGKYEVSMFSTFRDRHHLIDGVHYCGLDEYKKHPDILLAYYDVRPLQGRERCLRVGMHHTLFPYQAFPWIDVNTFPSQYALDHVARLYGRQVRNPRVVPNAVEGLEGVEWKPVPGRVVYHTSPDRGLGELLERWPEIRERVPHATLHVVGDPTAFVRANLEPSIAGSCFGTCARKLEAGIVTAGETGGVVFLGRLPRAALLEELAEAACFAFPSKVNLPCETWSISIHECCQIGVPVVLAPVDALGSLWGEVVESTPPIDDDKGEFVDAVVRMLTDRDAAAMRSAVEKASVAEYSFDRSARVLDGIVEEMTARARAR